MTEEQIKNATLAGGIDVEVRYRKVAEPETVFVHELPVKKYPELLTALNDEERQVEIFCDKPKGWGATLKPASHNEVMKAGEALNKAPFLDWCARRMEVQKTLVPGKVEAVMEAAFKQALSNLPAGSASGSPKSPSNAA